MTKSDLVKLFKKLNIPINEGEFNFDLINKYPKVVFWQITSQDSMASGIDYQEINTYQVSFQTRTPNDPIFLKLRNLLKEEDIHPLYNFEWLTDKGIQHIYFAIEVAESYG